MGEYLASYFREKSDQLITINLKKVGGQQEVTITAIYGKCDAELRGEL